MATPLASPSPEPVPFTMSVITSSLQCHLRSPLSPVLLHHLYFPPPALPKKITQDKSKNEIIIVALINFIHLRHQANLNRSLHLTVPFPTTVQTHITTTIYTHETANPSPTSVSQHASYSISPYPYTAISQHRYSYYYSCLNTHAVVTVGSHHLTTPHHNLNTHIRQCCITYHTQHLYHQNITHHHHTSPMLHHNDMCYRY